MVMGDRLLLLGNLLHIPWSFLGQYLRLIVATTDQLLKIYTSSFVMMRKWDKGNPLPRRDFRYKTDMSAIIPTECGLDVIHWASLYVFQVILHEGNDILSVKKRMSEPGACPGIQ
jgi:hypothetical protein